MSTCEYCGRDQNPSGNSFILCECYYTKPRNATSSVKKVDYEQKLKTAKYLYEAWQLEHQDILDLRMDLERMFGCFVDATTFITHTKEYDEAMEIAENLMVKHNYMDGDDED